MKCPIGKEKQSHFGMKKTVHQNIPMECGTVERASGLFHDVLCDPEQPPQPWGLRFLIYVMGIIPPPQDYCGD